MNIYFFFILIIFLTQTKPQTILTEEISKNFIKEEYSLSKIKKLTKIIEIKDITNGNYFNHTIFTSYMRGYVKNVDLSISLYSNKNLMLKFKYSHMIKPYKDFFDEKNADCKQELEGFFEKEDFILTKNEEINVLNSKKTGELSLFYNEVSLNTIKFKNNKCNLIIEEYMISFFNSEKKLENV